jgi:hypothetical protein
MQRCLLSYPERGAHIITYAIGLSVGRAEHWGPRGPIGGALRVDGQGPAAYGPSPSKRHC